MDAHGCMFCKSENAVGYKFLQKSHRYSLAGEKVSIWSGLNRIACPLDENSSQLGNASACGIPERMNRAQEEIMSSDIE